MLFYYLVFIAGRSAKENLLFTEVTEGMNSYGVTRHRHGKFILLGISLSSIVDSRLTEWIRFF
jgi:N-acetyl-gamma-glutamylphosphate reductase